MSYSPSNTYASIGLLNNQGLDLSKISSSVSSFNSSTFTVAFKNCITLATAIDVGYGSSVNAPLIYTFGSSIMPGLLGTMPSTEVATLGSTMPADRALTQAQAIFPGGDISSFCQNFGKANGSASMTNDLVKAAQHFNATDLVGGLGGAVKKFSDTASGGFANLKKSIDGTFADIGNYLSKMGNSQNINYAVTNDLLLVNNSVSTVKNIFDHGAGDIGGLQAKVAAIGITHETIEGFQNNKFAAQQLSDILGTITDSNDLARLKVILSISDDVVLTSARDLSDPTKAIPAVGLVLDTGILTKAKELLGGLPGNENIINYTQLGNMCAQLKDTPDTSILDSRSEFISTADYANLKTFVPIFDNEEAGPTTADLIGICSGGPFVTMLAAAKESQEKLATTPNGLAILGILSDLADDLNLAADDDWTTTPMTSGNSITDWKTLLEIEMTALSASADLSIQAIGRTLGIDYTTGVSKLSNQVTSLSRMGIDLSQVQTGNKLVVMGFGRSIGDLAKNSANEEILMNLCSDSAVGQAIKCSIVEKRNLEIMGNYGLLLPNEYNNGGYNDNTV